MKLQKQTGKADCLIYSAAMVLDVDAKIIIKELGHDGSAIWWPKFWGNFKHRAVHMQEILDCFIRRNLALMPIELHPTIIPDCPGAKEAKTIYSESVAEDRFRTWLTARDAIIIGLGKLGLPHAVAWNGFEIYDPVGLVYPLEDFQIREAWAKCYLESNHV